MEIEPMKKRWVALWAVAGVLAVGVIGNLITDGNKVQPSTATTATTVTVETDAGHPNTASVTTAPSMPASSTAVPNDPLAFGDYAGLEPQEVLAAARKLIATWKDGTGAPISGTAVDSLLSALAAVSKSSPAAQPLQDQLKKKVAAEDNALATAIKQELLNNTQPRINYANLAETSYLKQGMDVTMRVSGAHKTTLTMTYVLIGRPTVYQMVNNASIMSTMKELGFTTLVLTDGYDKTWTYNLDKKSFR
jgi:hypothetical protein